MSGGYACGSVISFAAMFAPFPAGWTWKICYVTAISSLRALVLGQPFHCPSSSLRLWLSGVYVLIKLTHSAEHLFQRNFLLFFWIRLSLNAEVSIILLFAMSLSFKEELLLFTFSWENCLGLLDNQHCLALPWFLFI